MGGWKLTSLALALIVSLATPTNAATALAVEDAPAAANCTADDGSVIPRGKDKLYPADTSCTILRCTDHGLDRLVAECEAPRCVQPRRKPGACCLTCPEGFNCRLPTGEILDARGAFTNDTTRCVCPIITTGLGWDQDLSLAVCQPVTTTPAPTTPPPPSCLLSDGSEIGEGEVSVVGREDGGCTRHECGEGGWLVVKYGDCPAVECPEPVRRPGACCRTCPDGDQSSRLPGSSTPEGPEASALPDGQSRLGSEEEGVSSSPEVTTDDLGPHFQAASSDTSVTGSDLDCDDELDSETDEELDSEAHEFSLSGLRPSEEEMSSSLIEEGRLENGKATQKDARKQKRQERLKKRQERLKKLKAKKSCQQLKKRRRLAESKQNRADSKTTQEDKKKRLEERRRNRQDKKQRRQERKRKTTEKRKQRQERRENGSPEEYQNGFEMFQEGRSTEQELSLKTGEQLNEQMQEANGKEGTNTKTRNNLTAEERRQRKETRKQQKEERQRQRQEERRINKEEKKRQRLEKKRKQAKREQRQ